MSREKENVLYKPCFLVLSVIGAFGLLTTSMVMANDESVDAELSAIEERTAPVGQVDVAVADGATESDVPVKEISIGQKTYDAACGVCHAAGIAGAPKYADADAWTARIEQGRDTLYEHAINGFTGSSGMMPAKGGRTDIADDDIKAAVDYMLEAVGSVPVAAETTEEVVEATTEEVVEATTEEVAETTEMVVEEASVVVAVPAGKGKEVYDSACFICHTSGVAGAPKLGDKEAWAPRIARGKDTLYEHALKGFMGDKGMMPAKGGRADIADEDIKAAVDYMIVTGA